MTDLLTDLGNANTLGALVALLIYVVCILVFCVRLAGKSVAEHRLGMLLLVTVVPLTYLLMVAKAHARPPIYYVQLSLMIVYLVVEFVLDYALKSEFRKVRWKVILYVTLFFGATGGMIGVASNAGTIWMYAAVGLFLVMSALAFVQRAKTGM